MKVRSACLSLMGLNLVSRLLASPDATTSSARTDPAAQAINALGLDLLAKGPAPGENALLSPYSIQSALAMAFAGAAGDTRAEMARILHYNADESDLHLSFAALRRALEEVAESTGAQAERAKKFGGSSEPVALMVANRLFGQESYEFRAPFLSLLKDNYAAPLQPLDFVRNSAAATQVINRWVEEQTRQRIRDLIPPDGLSKETRLVLVNAIYLKAPWADAFAISGTKPEPFHGRGGQEQSVPSMVREGPLGYAHRDGFSVITIPYSGGEVQFLILLPDESGGLASLESKLTPGLLADCANPATSEVVLHLPKFKIEPPLLRLGKALQSLGMRQAFDDPQGSANFDRLAPRKPDDYLFISEVFHKTFLTLDENGTEAAAATAVAMMRPTSIIAQKPKPVEVRVDHPFLFAIQHRASGACLFWGRVTEPR